MVRGKLHRGRGHYRGNNNTFGRRHGNRNGNEDLQISENETAFKKWRRQVPNGHEHHSSLSSWELASFMQGAQRLVELRDDAVRHEVITTLASEGGVTRVVEMISVDTTALQPTDQVELLKRTFLPLFRAITHADVLSSLLLEQALGNIFVVIYGTGGRRAIRLFGYCESVLRHLLSTGTAATIRPATTTILAALLQLLESNQGAALIKEFEAVVDVLQACLEVEPETFKGTLAEQAALRDMTLVRRFLKYGENIKPYEVAAVEQKKKAFSFGMTTDGPGELSSSGRRHDNDHEAITQIKILPTAQEICSPLSEYLPTKDSASWHIPGISGLIDQQFRLLREDTIGQLRDCIHRTMDSIPKIGKKFNAKHEKNHQNGLKAFTYSNVRLSDATFEKGHKQVIVVATFDQPDHLHRASTRVRETWWEDSKRLQVDSLVSIVDSDGNALFFTVADRGDRDWTKARTVLPDKTIEEKKKDANVGPSVKLWSNALEAIITLRVIDMNNPSLAGVLGRDWKSKQSHQVLVEFPGILLPSFEPTLKALQRMSQAHDIPFSDLLLPGSETADGHLLWPAYATQPSFSFDLGCITQDKGHLRLAQGHAFDYNALKAKTSLDNAQAHALIGALSRNLALVQGPPGTGKSYVAVQAVKVLLECRDRAKLGPIICV